MTSPRPQHPDRPRYHAIKVRRSMDRYSVCATGLMALGRVELIEADEADVVVVGGAQSVTEACTGIATE